MLETTSGEQAAPQAELVPIAKGCCEDCCPECAGDAPCC